MRVEFEKTTTFKHFYSNLIFFDADLDCYIATEKWRSKEAELLTAAWWMFQEQQGQIADLKKQIITQGQNFNNQSQNVCDLKHRINNVFSRVDVLEEEAWKKWKQDADKYTRGRADAFNEAYDILERALAQAEGL